MEFQTEIAQNILEGNAPEHGEVNVSVTSLEEARAAKVPFDLEPRRNFGVTRPRDFSDKSVPTFVVYREGLLGTWEDEDYANGLPGLLATVLLEVTFQLLGADVDSDSLRRNIIRLAGDLL